MPKEIILEKSKHNLYVCLPGLIIRFDDLKFLLKAYDKNASLDHWHNPNVIIKDRKMIVTDGHRIHMIGCNGQNTKIDKAFNGQYKVQSNTAKIIILEQSDEEKEQWNQTDFFEKMEGFKTDPGEEFEICFYSVTPEDLSIEYTKVIRSLPDDITLNFDLFKDLTCSGKIGNIKIIDNFMIYFNAENLYAVLMPMKMLREVE